MFKDVPDAFNDPRILNAYVVLKKYDRAIELYKEKIETNPDDQDAYLGLASVYLQNNQRSLALQTLRSASQRFPLLKTQIEETIRQIESGEIAPATS